MKQIKTFLKLKGLEENSIEFSKADKLIQDYCSDVLDLKTYAKDRLEKNSNKRFEEIIKVITKEYDVSRNEILFGASNFQNATPRHIFVYIAHNEHYAVITIRNYINYAQNNSVYYAINTVNNRFEADKEYVKKYKSVMKALANN